MKPSNFTNFLESGAFVRVSPHKWILLEGPFIEKAEAGPGEVALYHPDFFSEDSCKYLIPKYFYTLTDEDLESLGSEFEASFLPPLRWQEAKLESFAVSFREILGRIQQGSLKKAVPIVFENSTESINAARIALLLKELLKAPASLYCFGSWQKGHGIIGATPEVLLRQEGRILQTMALAGTCPKEDVAHRGFLLEDPKERHEHDLVVQDISRNLEKYGSLRLRGPQILELPTLLHLKTEIECQLPAGKAFSFFEACRSLHPTSALGVFPRDYGYEWMKSLPEQKDRRGFGAPWGISWSAEDALCLVAIRNIQWNPGGCRIGSGCGIVAQSDLQREWQELSQKRKSVKKVLGLE
ncbi:MAG: chorismate-binding protein [Pseudobdellovibrionaceae bacterium]